MCQCLCCECWWCNYCGVCCAGWHWAACCCSCWACKPIEMMNFDPDCCHCCLWSGYGHNCFCLGNVCCAPVPLKQYSKFMSSGGVGGNVVVINNPGTPMPMRQIWAYWSYPNLSFYNQISIVLKFYLFIWFSSKTNTKGNDGK